MSLLGGGGGGSKKFGAMEKAILFAVLGFIAYTMLPEITAWAVGAVTQVTDTLHRLAVPIAIGAVMIGGAILLSPKHRSPAWKVIQGGFGLAALAGIAGPAVSWVNVNTPTLVVGAMNMLANIGHGIGL